MRGVMAALMMLALAMTAPAAVAFAHTPLFPGRQGTAPVRVRAAIEDPEQSWAIYGRLGPGQTDVVPIRAARGQSLHLEVLVPRRTDLAGFRPQVVLIGPGLPAGSAGGQAEAERPGGQGFLTVPTAQTGEPFYEPFTQTAYWVLGSVDSTFPVDGTYRLVISDPGGRGGLYTVALGRRERFSVTDLLTLPLTWARIRVWLWK